MPKMKEKSGTIRTEPNEVLRLLKQARPDQLEATELPDGSYTIHFIPEKPIPTPKEKGKWARVAEEFSRKAPLLGISEEFLDLTRRFRQNFALKSPFDTKE
jgi:hypothetical protein